MILQRRFVDSRRRTRGRRSPRCTPGCRRRPRPTRTLGPTPLRCPPSPLLPPEIVAPTGASFGVWAVAIAGLVALFFGAGWFITSRHWMAPRGIDSSAASDLTSRPRLSPSSTQPRAPASRACKGRHFDGAYAPSFAPAGEAFYFPPVAMRRARSCARRLRTATRNCFAYRGRRREAAITSEPVAGRRVDRVRFGSRRRTRCVRRPGRRHPRCGASAVRAMRRCRAGLPIVAIARVREGGTGSSRHMERVATR